MKISGKVKKGVKSMGAYDAKKQFQENLNLFGNSSSQPEKFNLYAGLVNLADSIIEIQDKLNQIERKIRS